MNMPRKARSLSSSNIYHVMLRGINRQDIFEDDTDRTCFMKMLAHCKKISGFRLYAFVLMSNHVHLLIEPVDEPLDTVFRRLATRYAKWYNTKYDRTGHLFQDRFRSENVETDMYFTTVLRYILHNPMKAGLESHPGSYRWSSYLAYAQGKGTVTDTQFALDLFGSREALMEYLGQKEEDSVLDEEDCDRRLREQQVKEKFSRITGCDSPSDFQQLDRSIQREYVKQLYHSGLSHGQISRFTGIPKATIFRTVKAAECQPDEDESLLLHESDYDYIEDDSDSIIW